MRGGERRLGMELCKQQLGGLLRSLKSKQGSVTHVLLFKLFFYFLGVQFKFCFVKLCSH